MTKVFGILAIISALCFAVLVMLQIIEIAGFSEASPAPVQSAR